MIDSWVIDYRSSKEMNYDPNYDPSPVTRSGLFCKEIITRLRAAKFRRFREFVFTELDVASSCCREIGTSAAAASVNFRDRSHKQSHLLPFLLTFCLKHDIQIQRSGCGIDPKTTAPSLSILTASDSYFLPKSK